MRIVLSKKKHLPGIRPDGLENMTFSFAQYRQVKRLEHSGLALDERAFRFLMRYDFEKPHYFPPFSLKDKTVLIVGAGCGEMVLKYLEAGASEVVCVENDWVRCRFLQMNFGENTHVKRIERSFSVEMLSAIPHDFFVMNIGGYEIALLEYPFEKLKPCSVLVHCQYLLDKFKEKGFVEIKTNGQPSNGYGWVVTP